MDVRKNLTVENEHVILPTNKEYNLILHSDSLWTTQDIKQAVLWSMMGAKGTMTLSPLTVVENDLVLHCTKKFSSFTRLCPSIIALTFADDETVEIPLLISFKEDVEQ